jgi:branched-chain amino acid aminotransferase
MSDSPPAGLDSVLWLDGSIVPVADARISPFDHGFTVGDGVFETLKVLGGEPFAMRRHIDRLGRSASALGLETPPVGLVRRAATELIEAAGATDARLRITLTGGPGPQGSDRGDAGTTLLLALSELGAVPDTTSVATVEWTRNERGALVGLKTTSYAENVLALSVARRAGATEALFANTVGNLCEGTGSNIFVGIDGRLVTPPLSAGPLAGITRELVLEITDAVEEDLPFDVLLRADEAFLTSSIRDVQGIAQIDGRALPEAPGPLTLAAAAAFADLVASGVDP